MSDHPPSPAGVVMFDRTTGQNFGQSTFSTTGRDHINLNIHLATGGAGEHAVPVSSLMPDSVETPPAPQPQRSGQRPSLLTRVCRRFRIRSRRRPRSNVQVLQEPDDVVPCLPQSAKRNQPPPSPPPPSPSSDAVVLSDGGSVSSFDSCSSSSPVRPRVSGEEEVYERSLLPKGQGFPLYNPPPLDKPLRFGDFGILGQDGFETFGNLFNPKDQQEFSLSNLPQHDTRRHIRKLHEGQAIASGVEDARGLSSGDQKTTDRFEFHCRETQGAVLAITSSGELESLTPKSRNQLREYLCNHGTQLMRTLRRKHFLEPNQSLYVVTGTIKSDSWAIAVHTSPMREPYDQMVLTKRGDSRIGLPTHEWTSWGSADARCGASDDIDEAGGRVKDQCLFLRGFLLTPSPDLEKQSTLETGDDSNTGGSDSSHSKDTGHDRSNGDHSSNTRQESHDSDHQAATFGTSLQHQLRGTLETRGLVQPFPTMLPSDSKHYYPSRCLNESLLKLKNVELAITHDDDWRYKIHDGYLDDDALSAFITESWRTSIPVVSHRAATTFLMEDRLQDHRQDGRLIMRRGSPGRQSDELSGPRFALCARPSLYRFSPLTGRVWDKDAGKSPRESNDTTHLSEDHDMQDNYYTAIKGWVKEPLAHRGPPWEGPIRLPRGLGFSPGVGTHPQEWNGANLAQDWPLYVGRDSCIRPPKSDFEFDDPEFDQTSFQDESPDKLQLDLIRYLSLPNSPLFNASQPLKPVAALFPDTSTIFIIHQEVDLHITTEIDRRLRDRDPFERAGLCLPEENLSTIKQRCAGMFLHASLQLEALSRCMSFRDVGQALSNAVFDTEDALMDQLNRAAMSELSLFGWKPINGTWRSGRDVPIVRAISSGRRALQLDLDNKPWRRSPDALVQHQHDVKLMQKYLLETAAWSESKVASLNGTSDTPRHMLPTYTNIMREIRLLGESNFLYTGHADRRIQPMQSCKHALGLQVNDVCGRSYLFLDALNELENDGLVDIHDILQQSLVSTPPGWSALFGLLDTCPSGTLLELERYRRTHSLKWPVPRHDGMDGIVDLKADDEDVSFSALPGRISVANIDWLPLPLPGIGKDSSVSEPAITPRPSSTHRGEVSTATIGIVYDHWHGRLLRDEIAAYVEARLPELTIFEMWLKSASGQFVYVTTAVPLPSHSPGPNRPLARRKEDQVETDAVQLGQVSETAHDSDSLRVETRLSATLSCADSSATPPWVTSHLDHDSKADLHPRWIKTVAPSNRNEDHHLQDTILIWDIRGPEWRVLPDHWGVAPIVLGSANETPQPHNGRVHRHWMPSTGSRGERAPVAGTHITYGAYACEPCTAHFTCDEKNPSLVYPVAPNPSIAELSSIHGSICQHITTTSYSLGHPEGQVYRDIADGKTIDQVQAPTTMSSQAASLEVGRSLEPIKQNPSS